MKIALCLLVLLMISTTQGQKWVLVWNDEFNGNSVDTSKWHFEIGNNNGWGNHELEYYTTNNHWVSNGILTIQARKEQHSGFSYTSTRMTTQNKFSIVYGKFEARAKLPYGQGIWPAFWLLGANIGQVGWPTCGEIDIMEYIGRAPAHVYGSVHVPGGDHTSSYTNWSGFQDWHTYAVNWQPNKVEYYVDGNHYGTDTPQNTGGWWVFNNNPMFILLNLAVGGNWPGNPDGSTVFPQQFEIDYVRVYEIDWSEDGNKQVE